MTITPWWQKDLHADSNVLINANASTLIQNSIIHREGVLSSEGALVIQTGKFTGRATEDKYVVQDNFSKDRIDWKNTIRSMSPKVFDVIKSQFLNHFNRTDNNIYIMDRSVGADERYSLGLRVMTSRATHALFCKNIFRESLEEPKLGFFTIFHCPELELDAEGLGLRSSTVIATNFTSREILIAGTAYAGEVKKSVFSVMNTILPEFEVLPMHAGANIDDDGKVSVFFGLSGTGKTTLSTDKGKKLIGDDEHGISSQGIFNIEGGCYAKTYNLTEAGEPQVFGAVNRFGAILENVVLDDEHRPVFEDKSITENGRGTYPLSFISEAYLVGKGPFPSNIFFLSADAMGVLPAIAKLTTNQALYYFLSGYTAKLAGTEIGLAGIKATFSHCFGAPFMMRHPVTYAELLRKYLTHHEVNVWLVNTGWYGGVYGIGKRYELSVTRNIIRAIQEGREKDFEYWEGPLFKFQIPKEIPGVETNILNPRGLWSDKHEYDRVASQLKDLFTENFKKFSSYFTEEIHSTLKEVDYPQ